MNILFFISHQPNPRFIKQLNYLAESHSVSLVCFRRSTLAHLNDAIDKRITQHHLGALPNAAEPRKRLWVYLKMTGKIRKLFKEIRFELLLVNNIDVLLLYVLSGYRFAGSKNRPKIAIEISDLREFVFGRGLMSRFMRWLERRLYKKYVDKLIVTSKKYHSWHFEKFFKKDVFVLENKLLSAEIPEAEAGKKQRSGKTVIGIVGLLLRKDEYIKLFETYKNQPKTEIHIYGKGQYGDVVEKYASEYENIHYFGPYNAFTDMGAIYGSVDMIYLVYDTGLVSLNNKLALPNKLYECMYYKVPVICSKGTYLEEMVLQWGIGVSIDYKKQGEIGKAVDLLMGNRDKMKKNFAALPRKAYIGDEDYKDLESFLTT